MSKVQNRTFPHASQFGNLAKQCPATPSSGPRALCGHAPRRWCPLFPLPPLGARLAVAGDAWQVVWADDSAGADQASDGFARVSWAFVRGADGPVVPGLVLGARTARGPLRIVTDSQYVARSIAKLRAWPWPPEWRHADPWHLLWHAAKLGALAASWVPAHRPRPETPVVVRG